MTGNDINSADARQSRGEKTRQALMQAAFREIRQHGYRAASLNDILKAASCTKGSLYHHFPDKHALGLAAVEHNVSNFFEQHWFGPLRNSEDVVETIKEIIGRHVSGEVDDDLKLGCPLQNLSQEMAAIDEDFRRYLESVFSDWRRLISEKLQEGQRNGTVRPGFNTDAAATMIIAAHQGTISMIKTAQDLSVGAASAEAFFEYLNSLKP